MDTNQPHDYPHRILVVVSGLSPQVLTETLYALVHQSPAYVPTEVHLVTTHTGAREARLSLLHPDTGFFHRLCRDYQLPEMRFDDANIHVLCDRNGKPLADIRTPEENEDAANFITETLRQLTRAADASVHVSIAGGRKTMGYYMGYALSLFARPQDRLSHVLVSPDYESLRHFFYPTPYSQVVDNPRTQRFLDAQDAEVTLAQIPFVPLRGGLPERILEQNASFAEAVDAARLATHAEDLILDCHNCEVRIAGARHQMPPLEMAFYAWLADRRARGLKALQSPVEGEYNEAYIQELLVFYQRATATNLRSMERTAASQAKGMEKRFFDERISRVNRFLKDHFSAAIRKQFGINLQGRGSRRYALDLPPERIRVLEASSAVDR